MRYSSVLAVILAFTLVFTLVFTKAPPIMAQDLDTPRPIDALDTVWIEEMTWMEVRDAIADGKTTAIVAAGSLEQNGPYIPTAKHAYVLRATTEAIARQLGNALIAPMVRYEPGDPQNPRYHELALALAPPRARSRSRRTAADRRGAQRARPRRSRRALLHPRPPRASLGRGNPT